LALDRALDLGMDLTQETDTIDRFIELVSVGLAKPIYIDHDTVLAGFGYEPVIPEEVNHGTRYRYLTA
jgi:hypothetical protein